MMINHKGTTEIDTERLLLRRFKASDAEAMFTTWANDPEVTRYLSWRPHGTLEVTKEIISSWINSYGNQEFYNWAIFLKEAGKVVGSIGLVDRSDEDERCEIGYCIGKEYWNQGIMTEALKSVIGFFFREVGFNRIQAKHHKDNPASGRVMQKAGMKYEGRLRQYLKDKDGEFVDCDLYSIVRADLLHDVHHA